LTLGLVAVGALVRVVQLLSDRSLWHDEALLVLNILEKPVAEFFEPLDSLQGAPVGFLVAEKAAVGAFGPEEWALRLVPLAAGIVAVGFFAALARRVLAPVMANAALAVFAMLPAFTQYASMVKQYSVDVAVATGLLLAFAVMIEQRFAARGAALLAFAGTAALVVSQPATFVLAAGSAALAMAALRRSDLRSLVGIAAVGAVWLATFAVVYVVSLRDLEALQQHWSQDGFDAYAPSPLSPEAFRWLVGAPVGLFTDGENLGLPVPLAASAAVLALIGSVALLRDRPERLVLLGLVVALPLAAATVALFPWIGRFRLFVVPAVLILVAAGAEQLLSTARTRRLAAPVAAAGVVLTLAFPVVQGTRLLVEPHTLQEIEPALRELRSRWQPGDRLYVYRPAQFAFRYYAHHLGLNSAPDTERRLWPLGHPVAKGNRNAVASRPPTLIIGSATGAPRAAVRDLAAIRRVGGRVWLLFSHTPRADPHMSAFLKRVDSIGKRVNVSRHDGVVLALYALPDSAGQAGTPSTRAR
jgi:hypothetical protein